MQRYPGSILASQAKEAFYAMLGTRHRKPRGADADAWGARVVRWLLRWEGHLAAGLVLGALANLLIRVHMTERLIDLGRWVHQVAPRLLPPGCSSSRGGAPPGLLPIRRR
jgi:hypothetical protein